MDVPLMILSQAGFSALIAWIVTKALIDINKYEMNVLAAKIDDLSKAIDQLNVNQVNLTNAIYQLMKEIRNGRR